MKSIALKILPFLLVFASCENESVQQNNFIPRQIFNVTKSLDLPEAIGLQTPGGHAVFQDLGFRGVLVYNSNGTNFLAFDLAAPHVPPSLCGEPMDFQSDWPFITSYCGEEDVRYSVFTPYANYLGETYEMQEYNAVLIDNSALQIRNF
jgi:hypothetical protein